MMDSQPPIFRKFPKEIGRTRKVSLEIRESKKNSVAREKDEHIKNEFREKY